MARSDPPHWLFGPGIDLAMLGVPLGVAFAALAWVPPDLGRPLWAYLIFIVSFDVAHVWTTGFLTYFDRAAFAARRRTYVAAPAVCFVAGAGLHALSPRVFWSALAYFALYHFVKQQWGFVALYRARAGERGAFDATFDKVAVWTGALGPILLWHADPAAAFEWFGSGERFVARLPVEVVPWLVGWMSLVATAWVGRYTFRMWRGDRIAPAKVAWIVATWATWWIGTLVAESFLVASAFINLFHGFPYVVLVWQRVRYRKESGVSGLPAAARRWGWPSFYAAVLGLALLEEALWDELVWHDFLPALGVPAPALSAMALSVGVALLTLPQVVHYYLDGILWRGRDNPDVAGMLR